MTNQLDHYISNHIKSLYRHKLFSPILYMILLIVLWIIFPIGTILSPKVINEKTSLDKLYKENDRYVSITLTDLKFTGYTQEVLGQTHGYYYYTIQDGCCNIVLLSPKTSEEGLPNINKVTVHAKIQTATKSYHTLLSKIAADLNWTDSGIYGESSSYYISEPGFRYGFSIFLILLLHAVDFMPFSVSYVILYTFIFHGCHRPASSLPGSVLRRLFLCRQKKNWRHCHSWLRKICLLPSISLLKSLRMELPLFRFRKSSGFINIPRCTSSSGTISVSPIRCVSLRKSTYTSSVRRT